MIQSGNMIQSMTLNGDDNATNVTNATLVIRDGDVLPGLVLATALRRTLLHDVETFVFCYDHAHIENTTITISKNSTPLHNEMISHRLSMLPLNIDPQTAHGESDEAVLATATYTLDVTTQEQEMTVTTKSFTGETRDNQSALTREQLDTVFTLEIPIVKIRSGEEVLQLRCTPVRSRGSLCGGHSPVSACVVRQLESNTAELRVETIRGLTKLTPAKVLYSAFESLIQIVTHVSESLKIDKVPVSVASTSFTAYDFHFHDETATFGIMLQHVVALCYGDTVSHISYMQPHPLDKVIIIRIALVDNKDEESARDVLDGSLTKLADMLVKTKNTLTM